MGCRNAVKDIIEVNAITSYWNNGALGEVSAKAGHFTKAMKNRRKVLYVALNGCHKHGRVARIYTRRFSKLHHAHATCEVDPIS
jgi:hypothetical protein